VVEYLRKANKEKKVIINTIGFVSREGEETLKKIAEETGGTYLYVSEEDLKKYGDAEDEDG
jgi:hypothetical protein